MRIFLASAHTLFTPFSTRFSSFSLRDFKLSFFFSSAAAAGVAAPASVLTPPPVFASSALITSSTSRSLTFFRAFSTESTAWFKLANSSGLGRIASCLAITWRSS
uniref:Uncharacterized protein n=1 Tax=Cacopsylla melanoneura TaxID=428564 RepID=A0A8D8U7V8_9HEMI